MIRNKKKLVVLTGAGVSAESGLKTFRDNDGLWENHRVEDVATPEAFAKNPALVLRFYNERRAAAALAKPNRAHLLLAELEEEYDVTIITQNVDNLHEKAGSSKVLHLHGELSKVRSVKNEYLISDIGDKAISLGDLASDGHQLRPHIVWFGEPVPAIVEAAEICATAAVFLIIGTSLQVYPAAGLINYVPADSKIFLIDKNPPQTSHLPFNVQVIRDSASSGMQTVKELLTA